MDSLRERDPAYRDIRMQRGYASPGDQITDKTQAGVFMSGHGTFLHNNDCLYASVPGTIQKVNKLLQVKPVKSRYVGEVGDVVVGRIVEVQQKRWKVDTNSRLDSVLLSSGLMLPSGELRIKSEEDELMMRQYFQEGDLISAEVQSLYQDGSLSLQTRTVQFGKLAQGVFIKVPQYLIKRRKNHFHNLPCGASLILGCNGYVWLAPPSTQQNTQMGEGGEQQQKTVNMANSDETISPETRRVLARLHNCIRLLADHNVKLYDSSVMHAYNVSLPYAVSELLKSAVANKIAAEVRQLVLEENQLID